MGSLFKGALRNSILTSIILFFTTVLFSQVQQSRRFHKYSLKDGLSQVSVNDVLEDKKGYIWAGTQAGLNRFDGTFFKVFKNIPGDTLSICGDFINCLFEDNSGNIWIGTENQGVCYYSYIDSKFHYINLFKQQVSIYDISQDATGNIWLALGQNGVASISLAKNRNESNKTNVYRIGFFTSLLTNDRIIFGNNQGTVFTVTKTPDTLILDTIYQLPENDPITCLKINGNKKLLIGTRRNAYFIKESKFNIGESSIVPVFEDATIVYDFAWINNELKWIATGNGLYQFTNGIEHPKGKILYELNDFNPFSLSNNSVYSLYVSRDQSLWIGTGKHLNLLYNNPHFKTIQSIPGDDFSLNSNVVFSILKDDYALWVGTSGGGLNRITKTKSDYYTTKNSAISFDVVFSLEEDHWKNLWIGTKEGVSVITNEEKNKVNPKIISIPGIGYGEGESTNSFIRQVYCDLTGNIWLCTYNGGLVKISGNVSKNNYTLSQYVYTGDEINEISSNRVYTIFQDKDSSYWIGTNKGLDKLVFNQNNSPLFINYQFKKGDTSSISNNVVYDVLQDSEGFLWIGTRDGLNRFNPKTNLFRRYNKNSGLPDNIVYAILESEQKEIWISTNKGLAVLDKQAKKIRSYLISDGLQSNEFNLRAKYYDSNSGDLYFGGINGLNYFNPYDLKTIDKESEIFLSQVNLGNYKKDISLFTSQGDEVQDITLDYDELPLYLTFSTIDLRPYKTVDFMYRLLPGNGQWNDLGNKNEIQFLKLLPDDYILQIQGVSRGEIWKKKPFELRLKIYPPWWRTKLAVLIYILVFILVFYYIYRFQLKQAVAKKENKRLYDLDKLKNQLYTDITHEFRTPLTVILGIANELKNVEYPHLADFKRKVEMIERNGTNLFNLVNQMLDLSRIDQLDLKINYIQADVIPYLRYVFDCYSHWAELKKIKYTFYTEIDELKMDFDPDHLYKIISNLVSNAIKYSIQEGEVILHIQTSEDNLVLKISDTGCGISPEDSKRIFERFYRSGSTSENEDGVGIGLALTKELTELMMGVISLENQKNGAVFKVTLPIKHYASFQESLMTPRIIIPDTLYKQDSLPSVNSKKKETENEILIVEDNIDALQYIVSCLNDYYVIRTANNGTEGLTKAFEMVPDLIITDIMMPGMNGYELCDTLKKDVKTSHIPILMLTAKVSKKEHLKGYAIGADAFITKPFEKQELLLRLRRLLESRNAIIEKSKGFGLNMGAPKSKEEEFIIKAYKKIEKHLSNSEFKASDLAFELHLSESQLYRKIKAVTGYSSALFIRNYRLDKAKESLLHSTRSISEICYSCGFNDPTWFSRAFKERFDLSPTGLRENNK